MVDEESGGYDPSFLFVRPPYPCSSCQGTGNENGDDEPCFTCGGAGTEIAEIHDGVIPNLPLLEDVQAAERKYHLLKTFNKDWGSLGETVDLMAQTYARLSGEPLSTFAPAPVQDVLVDSKVTLSKYHNDYMIRIVLCFDMSSLLIPREDKWLLMLPYEGGVCSILKSGKPKMFLYCTSESRLAYGTSERRQKKDRWFFRRQFEESCLSTLSPSDLKNITFSEDKSRTPTRLGNPSNLYNTTFLTPSRYYYGMEQGVIPTLTLSQITQGSITDLRWDKVKIDGIPEGGLTGGIDTVFVLKKDKWGEQDIADYNGLHFNVGKSEYDDTHPDFAELEKENTLLNRFDASGRIDNSWLHEWKLDMEKVYDVAVMDKIIESKKSISLDEYVEKCYIGKDYKKLQTKIAERHSWGWEYWDERILQELFGVPFKIMAYQSKESYGILNFSVLS